MSGDVHVQFCERPGVRFPRATHRNLYVRSRRAGERVMASVTDFLARRLKLTVNAAKSAVDRPSARAFLGFSFTAGPTPQRVVSPKALARFKVRVRELTRRTKRVRFTRLVEELSRYLVGWRGYFGLCEVPYVLLRLDQWTRRRLRAVAWTHWKRGRTRFAALRRRGVSKTLAAKTASSAHGPWRISQSPALCIALPNAFFDRLGLASVAAGHAACHQARAPTTIHPAVAGRFTAPRVVTSSPSAAGSTLGYRTPQTSTDGRSLRLVSCCSEPGKPDPHRSVATAAATAPSP